MSEISIKPYLLRALYEWCTENGYTPCLETYVDARTRVPREFVKDGKIVLNISFSATKQLKMGNDWIEFHARFGEVAYKVEVPVANVRAIYARENGQGMAFPVNERDTPNAQNLPNATSSSSVTDTQQDANSDRHPNPPSNGRKHLKIIK